MVTKNLLEETILPFPFPTSAYIGIVEKEYQDLLKLQKSEPKSLLLDLGKCKFIDVTTLLWLLSILKDRALKKLETKIELPKNKNVRDFLRVWMFPEALSKITRKPFFGYVTNTSKDYFGENKDYHDLNYGGNIIENGMNRLLSVRFFSLIVFQTSMFKNNEKDVVSESDRFNSTLVKSVLSKQLSGPVSYIPSRIIFESIMNSIRHPDAENFVLASFLDGVRGFQSDRKKLFTISLWDDGKSMIHTIRNALMNDLKIRAGCDSTFLTRNFYIILEDPNGNIIEKSIKPSEFTPDIDHCDQYILFSTLLPGITCDVTGKGKKTYKGEEGLSKPFTTPGMGLFVLLNAVIDIFGGELTIRCDKYLMNIKNNKSKSIKADYQVKIKSMHLNNPEFLGNMLTIRLPIINEG